jgi:hypothetical protein
MGPFAFGAATAASFLASGLIMLYADNRYY